MSFHNHDGEGAFKRAKNIDPDMDNGWIKSSRRKPEQNVGVLVFIPEEDNHVTTGMWDVSNKWVLLDEYRIPKSEVTYWRPIDYVLPNDKTYKKSFESSDELGKMSDELRRLQKENYELKAYIDKFKTL